MKATVGPGCRTDQLVVELEHHLLAGVHDLLAPDDLRLLGGLLLTRLQLLPQLLHFRLRRDFACPVGRAACV